MTEVLFRSKGQQPTADLASQSAAGSTPICKHHNDNNYHPSKRRERSSAASRSSIGTASTTISTFIASSDSSGDEEYDIDDLIGTDTGLGGEGYDENLNASLQQLPDQIGMATDASVSKNEEVDAKQGEINLPPTIVIRPSSSCPHHQKGRSNVVVDDLSFSLRSLDTDDLFVVEEDELEGAVAVSEQQESILGTKEKEFPPPHFHRPHSVQFSTVTIRDYPRAMSDNPASSIGPAISIGWNYEEENTYIIDEYESSRMGNRRYGREMIIPSAIREDLLRHAGYSRAEIMNSIRELNVARTQRRRTYDTLHLQGLHAVSESIARKVINVLSFGEFKRKKRATEQELYRTTTSSLSSTCRRSKSLSTELISSTTTNSGSYNYEDDVKDIEVLEPSLAATVKI